MNSTEEIIKALVPNSEDDTKYRPTAPGLLGLSILRYHEPPAALCETKSLKNLPQLTLGV
jgi:hypothetical protein